MSALNPVQRLVADTYCGGEFAKVASREEAETVGDTLFLFIIRELQDVTNHKDACARLLRAIMDINEVLGVFE